jgi:glycerol-3-phosphate acyltransferase PlsY
MELLLAPIIAYLYGSIPFGHIATRILTEKSLAEAGTGNIGVSNAFKVAGKTVGIITVVGEISKACLPILMGAYLFPENKAVTLLLIYCSFLGTNFSIFLRGKGGKGTTMIAWSMLLLSPYALIVLLLIWGVIYKASKGNLHIRRIWLLSVPVVIFLFERDVSFTLFGFLYSLLSYVKSVRTVDDFAYYGIFQKKPAGSDEDQLHS